MFRVCGVRGNGGKVKVEGITTVAEAEENLVVAGALLEFLRGEE